MSKQAFKRVRKHLKMEVCRKPLDSFAWPGGYPLFYIVGGDAFCPDCANKEIEQIDESTKNKLRDGWKIEAFDINYEDDDLFCQNCSKQIESAYGGK